MEMHDRVMSLVAEAILVDRSQVSIESTSSDFKEWDSMGTMNIMLLLDSELGLSLAPGDTAGLQSVAGILALLERAGSVR